MKKSLQSLVLLLLALMLPVTATAAYEQLADGVYLDGTTLYICSGVTSLRDLQVNPSEIYCYAIIPPACVSNTFTGYNATLHVPAAGMVSYFTALYWYNFNNIFSDAIEPLSVTMNTTEAQLEIDQQLSLSATVAPGEATPKTVYWSSTNTSIATVSNGGKVTAVAVGECDILATCLDKVAVCHVTVSNPYVTITLDKHEAQLLPNHTITLTATCSPVDVELVAASSNPGVAVPRLVNGTIMVVGVTEGTAIITVNAADGRGDPDSCSVTVYIEPGDVNIDGYVNISDVTALIDYLLSGTSSGVNLACADCNKDGNINISDVTTLIDFLLSGIWPWELPITYTVNGVSFKMVPVEGGTFTMGRTAEQGYTYFSDETPAHQVTLSSYCIGETEVTQALWQAVMGSNPSRFLGDLQRPVELVSWDLCQTFITKLNKLTGCNFRLPTEAEWEFAARGGNKSKGYKYAGSNTLRDVAWSSGSSSSTTHAVATKLPNELGLYDMSGNVWEWCLDWYSSSYYSNSPSANPMGPVSGSSRVDRGDCWWGNDCRLPRRGSSNPSNASDIVGLRLALDKEYSNKFRLSETVVTVLVGESKMVEILNGNDNYSVAGTNNVTTAISGNTLTVIGSNEGVTTLHVTNTSNGAIAVLTVIVNNPNEVEEREYADLGLPSGTLWATCNVGAVSPAGYGDYFAWGEVEPKEGYFWSNYKWCTGSRNTLTKYCTMNGYGKVDNKTVLDPEDDAAYVNCGSSWHIPSNDQISELRQNCTWTWTTMDGVNGYQITGPNGTSIFLPAAGYYSDESLISTRSKGYYWLNCLDHRPDFAYFMYMDSTKRPSYTTDRNYGFTVRAVFVPQN